jgi:hypothetical protein
MNSNPMMMLAFLAASACAAQPAEPSRSATGRAETKAAPTRVAAPDPAPEQAELRYRAQLGATRGGRSELDRQVAELRQAKLLYLQFLERAEGRPELEAAVRKSRERVEDVQHTIDFLLEEVRDGAPADP